MGSMSAASPGSSFEQFGSQVSEIFFPMDCDLSRDCQSTFQATLTSRQLGQVGFAAVRSSPLDVYRRRTHIAQVADAMYLVKVQVSGEGLVEQRGKQAHLYPGDFTLCLSSEPYELHFPTNYSQAVLAVPETVMLEYVHRPDRHLGVRMDSKVGANGLFTQFVSSIALRLDGMDGVLAQRLEANVIDLLATTLGYAQDSERHDLLNSGARLEYRRRIKGFIRKHLHDDRLGPDWIAAAHNISTRYLHMLFEGESVSISRYILRLRLQACRAALMDAAFSHYSVSEIAYRFGFKDSSHFSRAFKMEFGATPARFRKSSQAETVAG